MTFKIGGYRRDPEENDDRRAMAFLNLRSDNPGKSDLRPFSEFRENQRATNSCVAQSVTKALEVRRAFRGHSSHQLSALWLYFATRQRMNPPETHLDEGTFIWLACDTIRKIGAASETVWPWNVDMLHTSPPMKTARDAYMNRITRHRKIKTGGDLRLRAIKTALADGCPVVWGCDVGANWTMYKGTTALEPCPADRALGGHATVLLGWDGKNFIGENSWGRAWGDGGFFYATEKLIAHHRSFDFWVID